MTAQDIVRRMIRVPRRTDDRIGAWADETQVTVNNAYVILAKQRLDQIDEERNNARSAKPAA